MCLKERQDLCAIPDSGNSMGSSEAFVDSLNQSDLGHMTLQNLCIGNTIDFIVSLNRIWILSQASVGKSKQTTRILKQGSRELYTSQRKAPGVLLGLSRNRAPDHGILSVHAARIAHHKFCQMPNNYHNEESCASGIRHEQSERTQINCIVGSPDLLLFTTCAQCLTLSLHLWLHGVREKAEFDLWIGKISIWLQTRNRLLLYFMGAAPLRGVSEG